MNSFFMIYNLITIALANRFIPNLYRIINSSNNHLSAINYYNENKNSIVPYILISPLIFVFGHYIHPVGVIFRLDVFVILVFSVFFMYKYSLFVNFLHFYEKVKLISISTLISFIINLILNFILIPYYAEIGAAISTLVSYIALYLLVRKFGYSIL